MEMTLATIADGLARVDTSLLQFQPRELNGIGLNWVFQWSFDMRGVAADAKKCLDQMNAKVGDFHIRTLHAGIVFLTYSGLPTEFKERTSLRSTLDLLLADISELKTIVEEMAFEVTKFTTERDSESDTEEE